MLFKFMPQLEEYFGIKFLKIFYVHCTEFEKVAIIAVFHLWVKKNVSNSSSWGIC